MMKELTFGNFSAVMPFKKNHAIGLEAGSFGFSGYRETRFSAAYAYNFQDILSLGTKFNFISSNIEGVGSVSTFALDLGVNARISKTMTFGFSGTNVNFAKLKRLSTQTTIPTVLTAGIAYTPSDKILIVADVQKDIAYPVSIRGGMEYKVNQLLRLRAGVSTAPIIMNAGVGIEWKGLNVDFSNSIHEKLGYTPAFSLSYRLAGKVESEK
jgi:long-subunit fatty acid transport protein